MLLEGKGILLGQETVESQKNQGKVYFYLNVAEQGTGKTFQMQCVAPVTNIPLYSPVKFTVEVLQGKYPRFNLKNIEANK
jgi:hypothetical protein